MAAGRHSIRHENEDGMGTEKWGMTPIPERVAGRAAHRYEVNDECFISTYSIGSHGYAQIGWVDKGSHYMTTAHRAAWVSEHGQIPLGKTVDHTCKSRRCVRVEHLRLLDNFENARRTFGRDWPLGTCINGHEESHLRVTNRRTGKRECGQCIRDYRSNWDRRRKDKVS